MKVCTKCGISKPLFTDFAKRKGYAGGYSTWCNDCKRADGREYQRLRRLEIPYNYEEDRDKKLKAVYGISLNDYKAMLEGQGGACAICGTTSTGKRKSFHVDHCHTTSVVRGLLCGNCNSGIGNLRDSIDLLKKAIGYLEARS